MRRTPLWAAAAAAALAVSTLTGCGDDSQDDAADACASWETYRTAVSDLGATLRSEPTVEQVRDARDQVADAREDLDDALGDVAEDRRHALDSAWEDLADAVDDLPDDATLPQAAQVLAGQADAVASASDGLSAELGCS